MHNMPPCLFRLQPAVIIFMMLDTGAAAAAAADADAAYADAFADDAVYYFLAFSLIYFYLMRQPPLCHDAAMLPYAIRRATLGMA